MLEFTRGDILESDVEALVNPVNCVGVMGKGLALRIRQSFPENFEAYRRACREGRVVPGRMFVFATEGDRNPRFVVNFPTKRHWRIGSRLEDIESGLRSLVQEIVQRGIRSIAIPALGCGLGGLDWGGVRTRIEQSLSELSSVHALVFEPGEDHAPPVKADSRVGWDHGC